jgi:hypothetical protein
MGCQNKEAKGHTYKDYSASRYEAAFGAGKVFSFVGISDHKNAT